MVTGLSSELFPTQQKLVVGDEDNVMGLRSCGLPLLPPAVSSPSFDLRQVLLYSVFYFSIYKMITAMLPSVLVCFRW